MSSHYLDDYQTKATVDALRPKSANMQEWSHATTVIIELHGVYCHGLLSPSIARLTRLIFYQSLSSADALQCPNSTGSCVSLLVGRWASCLMLLAATGTRWSRKAESTWSSICVPKLWGRPSSDDFVRISTWSSSIVAVGFRVGAPCPSVPLFAQLSVECRWFRCDRPNHRWCMRKAKIVEI